MNTALNKKFFSYVIPSILAFALSGVYTIVDGFFIGQSLGDTGLTAITLGYPISALIGAVGTGLGLSGAIRFTILNAQGETQKRQECFSGTTLLMLLTAGLLTAILFAFAQPILHLLGARGNMLTLCTAYARVIALGAVFQLLATFVPVQQQKAIHKKHRDDGGKCQTKGGDGDDQDSFPKAAQLPQLWQAEAAPLHGKEDDCHDHGHGLSDDGRPCSTGHSPFQGPHEGIVQDSVRYKSENHRDHGNGRAAHVADKRDEAGCQKLKDSA